MNLGIKNACSDWLEIAISILNSAFYKAFTYFAGISAGVQIGANRPHWLPDWLQPIVLYMHSVSWIDAITFWGAAMLAIERTGAAFVRINQIRREWQIAKIRKKAKQ